MHKILFIVFLGIICSSQLFGKDRCSREISVLRRLVEINSGSGNVSGVNAVQKTIAQDLKQLGFVTEFIPNALDPNATGKLLVGSLRGENPDFLTFIAHADTVFELSSHFEGFKYSDGEDWAYGPGVADDKGGVVVALSGITRFLSTIKPKYSLRFLVAPSEETSSAGFIKLFQQYSRDSKVVLGFESSVRGGIINARRGNRWYKIRVMGKEGSTSAGAGINACLELATKLVAIQKLKNPTKNTTVGIGHFAGGKDKFNVTCGEATAKLDTRFADPQSERDLHESIENILKASMLKDAKSDESSQTTWEIADYSPSFPANEASKKFVNEYVRLIGEVEEKPSQAGISIGTADSNFFYRDGLIILDGLAGVSGGEHSKDEKVLVSSLCTRAEALSRFLKFVNQQNL